MLVEAVVTDFDASFAEDQGVANDAHTWASLRRLRDAGIRTVLCTGRSLDYLVGPSGVLSAKHMALFDVVIAEDGAVAWEPAANRLHLLGQPMSPFFVDALRRTATRKDPRERIGAGDLWHGLASMSTRREHMRVTDHVLKAKNSELRRLGIPPIDVHPIVNGTWVTWVSGGVDKGSGMLWALSRLGVSPTRAVGVGDGDNDADFMRLCGVAAPVGNAVAELHALPNAMPLRGHASAGFRELVRRVFSGEVDRLMAALPGFDVGV